MKIKILIPVYNDFQSVSKLITNINSIVFNLENEFSIILVNDSSQEKPEFEIFKQYVGDICDARVRENAISNKYVKK